MNIARVSALARFVISAIAVGAIAACGGGSSGGAAPVTVPNVVGNTQASATTAITGAGLTLGTVTMQSSGTVASGNVISESPSAGASVASGSAVNLVVSSGPPVMVNVPDVVGSTQAAATTAITGAGLVVGTVTMQSSGTVAAGVVISENPAATTSVASGSAVDLVVSNGPPPVSVPNVVGKTQAAATTAITAAGLTLGTVTMQSSSSVAAGNVISESPAAGTSVASGSAVNLVVSSGATMVTVPNVVGNTQAQAATAITGVGLTVGTVTQQASNTVAAGNVISENPAAGTSVASGSAVNLTVSVGPGYTIGGSITGLTASGLKLRVANSIDVAVASGATTFSTAPSVVASGADVAVKIATQPAGETCVVTNAAGAVASSNVSTVAVTCISNVTDPIVGVFNVGQTNTLPSTGWIAFFADGTYIFGLVSADPTCGANNGNGVEYGVYSWNQATSAFSLVNAVVDTNGSCGAWDAGTNTGAFGNLVKNYTNSVLTSMTLTNGGGTRILTPVASTPSSLVGGWVSADGNQSYGFFDNNGHYLIAATQLDAAAGNPSNTLPGVEAGCYATSAGNLSWNLNPGTCTLAPGVGALDTNGTAGLSSATSPSPYSVTGPNAVHLGPAASGSDITRLVPN